MVGSVVSAPAKPQELAQAVVQNDLATVRQLLDGGAEINRPIFGATSLHLAAEYGRADIAQLLLDKGAHVDPIDDLGRTPLLWAAENAHLQVARVLIAHGANVNQEDPSRFRGPLDNSPPDTPLDYALRAGNVELCRMLIGSGAKIRANDYTRLQAAIHSGKPDLVAMLIAKGVDPMARSKPDPNFNTYSGFATAGMSDNVEMIKLLVSKSRKGAALRPLLNDALQHAAEYGRTPVVRFLLDNTDVDLNREVESNYGGVERLADTKTKVPGFTALSRAIEQGHDDIADALLEKGARIAGRTRSGAPLLSFVISQNRDDLFDMLLKHNPPLEAVDYDGRTALTTAAVQGRLDIVKALRSRGASLDKRDSYQSTTLMLACEAGKSDVVEYLVNAGANLHVRDKDGRDALIYAAMGGHDGICSLLISRGVSPNALQPTTGMTALHWAAKKARAGAVKELLTHGASPEIADKDGKKPVDYARLAGDAESVALLSADKPTR